MSATRNENKNMRGGGWLRKSVAALGAVLLTAIGVGVAPMAAVADSNHNDRVVVSNVKLTTESESIILGDTLTVSGDWDATDAEPKLDQTFMIGLPKQLGFTQAVPFDLAGPASDGTDQVWATCLTDPLTGIATCTFSEAVESYPEQVLGSFSFDVEAIETTTEKELTFDLNGAEVTVAIPGDGGIGDGVELPEGLTKSGVLNSNKWSMTWTIDIPGAAMKSHETVTVYDNLSDNHRLCDPSGLTITTVRGSNTADVTGIGAITNDVSAPYDFALVLTEPDGGFDPNVVYRITYETCTPDGQIDPKGTEYENSAWVDIFPEGQGIIGIGHGVTQNWELGGTVSKTGSVLGGGERNGAISWTVSVNGSELEGKNGFTFSDELSGSHALCQVGGAYAMPSLKIEEWYGPTNQRLRNLTDHLDIADPTADAKSFGAQIKIKDGSDFAFKGAPYQYKITYKTCVTTEGLPHGGTVFGNEASVNGMIATGGTETPNRTSDKQGNLNTGFVELAGVEYLPQTTMGWTVTVAGEQIAAVKSDLTIVDTMSGPHGICGAEENMDSDALKAKLGFKIEARDQIWNGGLGEKNLTDSAELSYVDGKLTIVVPEPTLRQPDGGEATGFSREYQYVITYTTCTTSGGMDAVGTTYGNTVEVNGKSYGRQFTQNNSSSGTGQGMPRGTVEVSKLLADTPGAELVPADTVFTVHAEEIDPDGTVQNEFDLKVKADGTPVSGFNARGTGWTIRLSEPTFPTVAGVTWGAPKFAASPGVTVSEGGTVATAALTPGSNIAVALENTALLGSVEVVKQIDGGAADQVDPQRVFPVTASVDTSGLKGVPAQPDVELELVAGQPVVLENLPIGATVTFTEQRPADDDLFTWTGPTITPVSVEVTAEHAVAAAPVTITNHVERTVGTFSVAKDVVGAQAGNPAVPADVTVTASWNQEGVPGEKTLTLPTDGTPVPLGENLLIGTEVTLTETPLADGWSIAWAAPAWTGEGVAVDGTSAVVTIGRDADAVVRVQNHAATSTAGLSLIKVVSGEAAADVDDATEFPVTVTWTDADGIDQLRDLTINPATPTALGEELPAGTVVTITEGERPEIATVTWGEIVISGDRITDLGDGSASMVISDQHGEMTLVTVTNEATWAPGSFALVKTIAGIGVDHIDVPETVTVTATWVDVELEEQVLEIALPTDGSRVEFDQLLPIGTEVHLSEARVGDTARVTWGTPQWAGDGVEAHADGTATVTIAAGAVAEIELTNTATPVPEFELPLTGGGLPLTGFDGALLGGIAAVAGVGIALGLVLTVRGRRKTS